MTTLRKFLIYLRKLYSEDFNGWVLKLSGALFVSAIAGILVDKFLPFNVIFNTIRAGVTIIIALSLFSLMYILSIRQSITSSAKRADYLPIRKQFSYRQRVNITVLVSAATIAFALFINKASTLYTLLSGVSMAIIIMMLAFVRTYRNEFIKSSYGIPDIRDLEFDRRKSVIKEKDNNESSE